MSLKKTKTADPFQNLDWNDLRGWAGATIAARGREYQQNGSVRDLAMTDDHRLVASVDGTHEYAISVSIERGHLTSECTCPYGISCKHAVAVVLEYLRCQEDNEAVRKAASNDSRLKRLEGAVKEDGFNDWDDDDEDEDYSDDEDFAADDDDGDGNEVHARRQKAKTVADGALAFLKQRTKQDLIEIITDLARHNPSVQQSLKDRRNLAQGNPAKLIEAVRRDISRISQEAGWKDNWSGQGSIPNYAPVRERLNTLLSGGHADALIDIAEELLDAGTEQLEMSDDEGETAEEIASCLEIVFKALPQSSRVPAERLLWAIEMALKDQHELCGGAYGFLETKHAAADWHTVADELLARRGAKAAESEAEFSTSYRRDRLTDWIIVALGKSARSDEIIPLCETEADKTLSYVRLVNRLMSAKRWDDAERWIERGITATRQKWPGIASELRQAMKKLREREEDWLGVAAIFAVEFFVQPALETFEKLAAAAKRAAVWPAVREHALHYLETGTMPKESHREDGHLAAWPLPVDRHLEIKEPRPSELPMTSTLIDIAIAEKQPAEVLRWYDSSKQKMAWWGTTFKDDRVAKAVADRFPDRAVAIWKKAAESEIAHTKPSAYANAGEYLRKIRRVLESNDSAQEFTAYLKSLKQTHIRKRRLMDILDGLSGQRIVGRK
jgi:uncharacterized Zn finger protein